MYGELADVVPGIPVADLEERIIKIGVILLREAVQ